jgi:hypothetical protein
MRGELELSLTRQRSLVRAIANLKIARVAVGKAQPAIFSTCPRLKTSLSRSEEPVISAILRSADRRRTE